MEKSEMRHQAQTLSAATDGGGDAMVKPNKDLQQILMGRQNVGQERDRLAVPMMMPFICSYRNKNEYVTVKRL